jgi:hypothetical protein
MFFAHRFADSLYTQTTKVKKDKTIARQPHDGTEATKDKQAKQAKRTKPTICTGKKVNSEE